MYHFELNPFRTAPLNPAQLWEKEVEKIFDGFNRVHSWVPNTEIVDEEKAFYLSMDVPGLRKEDLDIEVKENKLTVSGERKEAQRNEKSTLVRSERQYGKFSRTFILPQNVSADAIQARFENGVLEIALPKEEKTQPKKITISDWKSEALPGDLKS